MPSHVGGISLLCDGSPPIPYEVSFFYAPVPLASFLVCQMIEFFGCGGLPASIRID